MLALSSTRLRQAHAHSEVHPPPRGDKYARFRWKNSDSFRTLPAVIALERQWRLPGADGPPVLPVQRLAKLPQAHPDLKAFPWIMRVLWTRGLGRARTHAQAGTYGPSPDLWHGSIKSFW